LDLSVDYSALAANALKNGSSITVYTQADYDAAVAQASQGALAVVLAEPSAYSLYTLDQIKDLRIGSTLLQVQDGQANLTLQLQESTDLNVWTNGSATTIQIPIQAGANTKFFRFAMPTD
jgi:hypothetical protein